MERVERTAVEKLIETLKAQFFKRRKKAELEMIAVKIGKKITEVLPLINSAISEKKVIGVVEESKGAFYYLIDDEMTEFLKKCEESGIIDKDIILHLFPIPEEYVPRLMGLLVQQGYAKILIPGKKIIMKNAHENFKTELLRYLSKHSKLDIKKYAITFDVPPGYITTVINELEKENKLKGTMDEKKLSYVAEHVEKIE